MASEMDVGPPQAAKSNILEGYKKSTHKKPQANAARHRNIRKSQDRRGKNPSALAEQLISSSIAIFFLFSDLVQSAIRSPASSSLAKYHSNADQAREP